jgi:hypothetical protein
MATGQGSGGQATLTMKQSGGATIPSGTKINVNMWIKSMRGSDECTFKIQYDGTLLGQVKPSGTTTQTWQRVGTGSDITYTKTSGPETTGPNSGLIIQVTCIAANMLPLFYIDDVSIIRVKGPAGEAVCGSPAPATSTV